jgi:hypothetical protein
MEVLAVQKWKWIVKLTDEQHRAAAACAEG